MNTNEPTPRRVTPGRAAVAALVLSAAYLASPSAPIDVSFRTHDGVHVLTAEPDGRLVADRTAVNAWEVFKAERAGGGFAFKSAHGKYVSAQPDGTIEVNRDRVDAWETFAVAPGVGDGAIGLRTTHGTFLVAEGGGGGDVRADRAYTRPGPWESFTPSKSLTASAGGAVSKAATVGRLRVAPDGFRDDTGLVLPVYAHAGNLFSLYTRDRPRARSELDAVASANYRGVRVWSTLGGSYWNGDHVGPDVTPSYWDEVAAFGHDLNARGLRAVWSQGDVGQIRDRRAYMARLASVDTAEPFIDFLDCGNEAWQTGEPDPARLADCVGYYKAAGGRAVLSLSSPPGETPDLLNAWSVPPADVWDVHSERGGRWWDKRRHIFSIAYEGKPRLRYGINSEPPGNGVLVSASDNKAELDDEAVAMLGVAGAMSRQAWVWFSGEGVKIRAGLRVESGFAATPRAIAALPNDVMSWPDLFHSGDRWADRRILEPQGEVRVDCARNGARFACTIDGPSGSYNLRVARSFTGKLCNPATGACDAVSHDAGRSFPVSFTRGRVLVGQTR